MDKPQYMHTMDYYSALKWNQLRGHCVHILRFIHLPPEGHRVCFQVLVMNKAAGNSLCAVLCVDINFQLLWVNTKEHDGLIIWWEFSFTRHCQTDFQSGYIILHSHQCESSCCSTSPSAFGVVNVLDFDHSTGCIGEGNGNPLQYSCLENPMDRGAWPAVHGIAKSWTRLSNWYTSCMVIPHCCFNLHFSNDIVLNIF